MNIEELFDDEIYHIYGMLTTDDANYLINYLKTETMEYVAGLEKRIDELEARNKEMMCAMREWYEDGFNRGDCDELIVKHGGEA